SGANLLWIHKSPRRIDCRVVAFLEVRRELPIRQLRKCRHFHADSSITNICSAGSPHVSKDRRRMASLEGCWSSYTHHTAVPSWETCMTSSSFISYIALIFLGFITVGRAQQPEIGVPVPPLGAGPFVFDTAEQHKIRVTVVTKGLSHPWAIAFLPDGNMLVTERPGRIRVIRNGVLDPTPITGVPRV